MSRPSTFALDKKTQGLRTSGATGGGKGKKSGHILKSPLKSTLGLFASDGPNLRRKKAAILNGAVSTSTPRSKPGHFNLYDETFSRSEKSHAGGDTARDALDEFRGLMEDRDEHCDAEVCLNGNEADSADEEGSEDWDVDTTFAKLLEQEQATKTPDHHLLALTDVALPAAFANASSAYRKEIVDTLLPTLRSISDTHVAFTKGGRDLRLSGVVVEFDDVCKEFEESVGEREEILEREFAEAKVRMDKLFEDLRKRYKRREQMDNDFADWISAKAENARARVNSLTEDMEDLITILNMKSKALDKNDGGAKKAQEKMLKGLLMKM